MNTATAIRKLKKNEDDNLNVEIGLDTPKEWSDEKLAQVKAFVKEQSDKRTPERKLRNEMLSIQYQMENYLDNENINAKNLYTIEIFLSLYLKLLNLTFKKFAISIDMTDGNLKKYLSGDRKFSTDLAMKFASFFHTSPDLWLNIQIKNELFELSMNKTQTRKYSKYNYEKVVA